MSKLSGTKNRFHLAHTGGIILFTQFGNVGLKKKFKARDDLQTEEQETNISWHIVLSNKYND